MVLLKMKRINLLLLLVLIANSVFAIEDLNLEQSLTTKAAYYFPDHQGYKLDGDLAPITYKVVEGDLDNGQRNIGSTWGGAELVQEYKLSLTKGIMQGDNFLTNSNHLKLSLKGKLSPVTAGFDIELLFSPIAFIDLFAGSGIDTGWYAIGVVGLGLNNKRETADTAPVQGVLSQSWIGGTFKFDLAAVLSGDDTWKHVVLLSSHKLRNRYFNIAQEDDAWVFQGSDGYNGVQYIHTTLLGYQMPLLLETAGFLVETTANLTDFEDYNNDYVKCRFGGIFNFKFNDRHSLAVLPQFVTRQKFTDDTIQYDHFTEREIDSTSPYFIDFERIAFVYSYKF